jgi:hypothetical protein
MYRTAPEYIDARSPRLPHVLVHCFTALGHYTGGHIRHTSGTLMRWKRAEAPSTMRRNDTESGGLPCPSSLNPGLH